MDPGRWDPPADLLDLSRSLAGLGFGLWPVGGCVRDLMLGQEPKDLDLTTDADPEAQVRAYEALGVRHVPTGISHGTVTVVLGFVPYEITSLRRDVTTDGRHAQVAYTTDRVEDLARRDLTINAMSMDMDGGGVLDPFGGADDLAARRVRFVGRAADRMREDHLRILRWLRFHGRFSPDGPLDPEAAEAAVSVGRGLRDISSERVWSEVSRILTGPGAVQMMRAMAELGLAPHVRLPPGSVDALAALSAAGPVDPAVAMSAYLGHDRERVARLAEDWRWSREDADRAGYVAARQGTGADYRRELALDRRPLRWVEALARADGRLDAVPGLGEWSVPAFPVTGHDLAAAGVPKGPGMGEAMRALKDAWAVSGYVAGRDELLATLAGPPPGPAR